MRTFRLISFWVVFVGATFSLLSSLFFPWAEWAWAFGISAFLIVIIAGWVAARSRSLGPRRSTLPYLAMGILGAVIVISLVTLFSTSRTAGVCDTGSEPIFAKRDHYFLNNHGAKTEVSRVRYLAVGTSFTLGWHSIVLLGAFELLAQANKSLKPTNPAQGDRLGSIH